MPATKDSMVRFSTEFISGTQLAAPEYDRSAAPVELFSCDVCHQVIRAGLRGFEIYATCNVCSEFDICGFCSKSLQHKRYCGAAFMPDQQSQTIWSKLHQHDLEVVDRGAQVVWANDQGGSVKAEKMAPQKRAKNAPRKASCKRWKANDMDDHGNVLSASSSCT
jgi:hypothetical protein